MIELKVEPHLTRPTIDWLEGVLTPKSRVLEVGAGGSTVWFAARVKAVMSYETQEKWFKKIKMLGLNNCTVFIGDGKPTPYGKYDLVFIDGPNNTRMWCMKNLYKNVCKGGFLLLDDSHGEGFVDGIEFMDSLGWPRIDFKEEGNYKTASAWQRT